MGNIINIEGKKKQNSSDKPPMDLLLMLDNNVADSETKLEVSPDNEFQVSKDYHQDCTYIYLFECIILVEYIKRKY